MRLLIARCEVDYQGRLDAHLPLATRLIMIKADGSLAIHSDSKAYKPLNWMTPPCNIVETDETITATNGKGEQLIIAIDETLEDRTVVFGDDPGLTKDGVEAELQELLSERVETIQDGLALIRREYPTDIGPVDILCRDSTRDTVAIEVKRIGEIAGVEQLARYLERLNKDPLLRPVRGILVATIVKPQARVLAESRDIACVEVDLDELREKEGTALKLF